MKQKITLALLVLCITMLEFNAQTLVAHYKFDGNFNDETGNWNLTETAGFTATFETGQDNTVNGAVSGFGILSANFLETASDFTPMTGANGGVSRTMAAWIKTSIVENQAIAGLGNGTNNFEKFTFATNKNGGVPKPRVEIKGGGLSGTTDVSDGEWYHLAVVYNDATKRAHVYLNGVEENAGASAGDWSSKIPATVASPLRVGNDFTNDPANRGFGGAIDDFRIYTGAADASFILNLYNNTKLAISKVTQKTFSAYPNPVKNHLYFSTNEIASVEIYNILGANLANLEVINNGVNMSGFSKGVYLVHCADAQGLHVATIKAVKE